MQAEQLASLFNCFQPDGRSPLKDHFLLVCENPRFGGEPGVLPYIFINTVEFERNTIYLYYLEQTTSQYVWQTLDKAISSLDLFRLLKRYGHRNISVQIRNSEAFFPIKGVTLFNKFLDLHSHWTRHSEFKGLLLS